VNLTGDSYVQPVIEARDLTIGMDLNVRLHRNKYVGNSATAGKVVAAPYARASRSLWDNAWYAGHHLLGYSVLFPPLASVVGPRALGALAAIISALLFERLARAGIPTLLLVDAALRRADDLVASDLVYPHRVGETYSVTYNPAHRWYYVPEMRRDEALLLKCCDTKADGRARFMPHTSFTDPTTPADAAPRESIELRTLVFHPA